MCFFKLNFLWLIIENDVFRTLWGQMRLQLLKIMEQLILIQTVLGGRLPSSLKLSRACIRVRFSPVLSLIHSLCVDESFSGLVWILESTKEKENGKGYQLCSLVCLWKMFRKMKYNENYCKTYTFQIHCFLFKNKIKLEKNWG